MKNLNLKFFSIILNIILILALWYFYIKLKNIDTNNFNQKNYVLTHKNWWLEYSNSWIVYDNKADFNKKYYDILDYKKNKDWYYLIWDILYNENQYLNYKKDLEEKLKKVFLIKYEDKLYVIMQNNAIKKEDFEKNYNIKLKLENYDFIILK